MDSTGIATTYAAFTQAQTGMALQSEMMKMAAQQDAALVALLQSGAENLQAVSNGAPLAAGVGGSVDISV